VLIRNINPKKYHLYNLCANSWYHGELWAKDK